MTIYVANWKMNVLAHQVNDLGQGIIDYPISDKDSVILCPPSIYLSPLVDLTADSPVSIGAQNAHDQPSGAFTGEISNQMLASLGCKYVIVGHSERRQLFLETDHCVNKKIASIMSNQLIPIVCIGETLEQRESGDVFAVIQSQLLAFSQGQESALSTSSFMIAYEPVWAIGTGKVATPDQAEEVHSFIKQSCQTLFGSSSVPVLYGGSVKPGNAASLLQKPSIDGFLVGGASLTVEDFTAIISAKAD